MLGKFFICATPIGNLEDASFRLISTLQSVDLILAEDTRRTRILLQHFHVQKPLKCFEAHREKAMLNWVLEQLRSGKNLALLSDAGTPGISDPGGELIPFLIRENIEVDYIPGPSSVIAALILSGLPMHSFLFHAFPPSKQSARRRLFQNLSQLKTTLIFFESPYRLLNSLEDMLEILGDRPAAVCRELTKIHQEVLRGNLSDIIGILRERKAIKGEITVVVSGNVKG
ncbi:MAG: 16S rRNA (cytidine(1402)-2'-O)-methyltransferase [bacterium]